MVRKTINAFRSYLLDRLVLRPTRHPIEHGDQVRVLFSSPRGTIETFLQSQGAETASTELLVLKFPGTAGRAERSTPFPAGYFPNRKCDIWTWNPPGYGGSQGRATLRVIAEAAVDFFRIVTERYAKSMPPVWLCGNSLGCLAAMHVASTAGGDATENDPAAGRTAAVTVNGLLLRNPPPLDLVVKRIANRYPFGSRLGVVADQLVDSMNAIRTAPRIRAPAIFFQSEYDTLVPPNLQQMIRDCYAGPQTMVLLQGIDHDGLIDKQHQGQVQAAIDWLWQQPALANASSSESLPCNNPN